MQSIKILMISQYIRYLYIRVINIKQSQNFQFLLIKKLCHYIFTDEYYLWLDISLLIE